MYYNLYPNHLLFIAEKFCCFKIIMLKYKVSKQVVSGEHFIEHRHQVIIIYYYVYIHYSLTKDVQAFNCQFTGKWLLYGSKNEVNPSNEVILCKNCVEDYKKRQDNYEKMDVRIKIRSYQVVGLTKPFNKFEWERTRCNNRSHCWGLSQRIFEVRQKPDRMCLIHYKIRPNQRNEEVVNRLYLSLTKKESKNEHIYTSIGSTSNVREFFWPDLFKKSDSHQNLTYYFHVSIVPRDPLPLAGLEDIPIAWWPDSMKSPDRIYPMTMTFSFYEASMGLPFPTSYTDLQKNHKPSHLTFLDMYEGGGGLRVSQYKWIENSSFEREDPLPFWTDRRSRISVDAALYENRFRPRWINPHHLDEENCYISNYQNGFAGPITSFWARLNTTNTWQS